MTNEQRLMVDTPEVDSRPNPSNQMTTWRSRKLLKTAVMYCTMVAVSATAIHYLEHASIFDAMRTALVAAVGKTIAANWVSGLFD